MCCLFGFYNYSGQKIKCLENLTNLLAENAVVRGSDAAGIAYNRNRRLVIHKEAKSACEVNFRHPEDVVCVMGHTRHATQGDKKKNYNNHPFGGACKNANFALAHNGVIINDSELKGQYCLPKTRIETDSYVAVQLLEKKKYLDFENIRFMSESLNGSFAFSILDSRDALWLIRGDSPLSLVKLPAYKLYIYASTDEILYKSLIDTALFSEIKRGNFKELKITQGDIFKIVKNGEIVKDRFKYEDYSNYRWWDYGVTDDDYIDNLKTAASYQGFSPEDIDILLGEGFSPEEIEEYIYCTG